MSTAHDKLSLAVVSACMTHEGLPRFAFNVVDVTPEEALNGIHYYLVEAQLLEDGFEEPFVHFPETEAPEFLHPAVRKHLGLTPDCNPLPPALLETPSWPELSKSS